MTSGPFYLEPAFWLYFAAWLPYTSILILYGFGSPWYRSPIGRSLFLSKLALFLILSFILLVLMCGEHFPAIREVRAVLMGAVSCAATYQFFTFRKVQRGKRKDPNAPRRRATDL